MNLQSELARLRAVTGATAPATPAPWVAPKDLGEAVERIKAALRLATGRAWSVKRDGGWIWVHAPPRWRLAGGFPHPIDRARLDRIFRDPGGSNSNKGLLIAPEDRETYVRRAEEAALRAEAEADVDEDLEVLRRAPRER